MKYLLQWSFVAPILAWALLLSGFAVHSAFFIGIAAVLLMASVMAAVHHSEVVAYKVGEPWGTIILAISVTILEVSIIISLMMAGGEGSASLARDTVFAAVMIILNGILGMCLLFGSIRFHEQMFASKAANIGLVSLVAILILTLILPNYTTSVHGPYFSEIQLVFISVCCLVLYGTFLLVQTVSHRHYFLVDGGAEQPHIITKGAAWMSLVFLLVSLGIVVLLAKKLSPFIESGILQAGLPKSLVGVIIAFVILLPEGIAAVNAARKDQFQTSINLALGSALASIGLTIPAVSAVCIWLDMPLMMGLDKKSMLLLGLSVYTVMLSLNKGKTNLLYGVVLLVNFAAYLFTTIFP